jgi:hypothetical protein
MKLLKLPNWSPPAKVLATAVLVMMGLGLTGALGQVIVHDIIPTFTSEMAAQTESASENTPQATSSRGDLFSSAPVQPEEKPFYETEKFIFALKFTHIHIFGMTGIFIAVGALVIFLDASRTVRMWLIALPFVGIVIDLLSVWLKIFVDPAFFWLHIPGGMLFASVFVVDALWILRQMWLRQG